MAANAVPDRTAQQVFGAVKNLTSLNKTNAVVQRNRYPAAQTVDKRIDEQWQNIYARPNTFGSYFDYYFSGQDIICCIDGTEDDPEYRTLPIISMQYNVQQQKMPLYGFWSYTYDAVLRGTRLIQGQCTMATRSPNYMKNCLAKAAESRANRQGASNYSYFRGLTENDKNIEQYWGKNIDPALNSLGSSIYSVHPPFSFVIIYGVQTASIRDGEYTQYLESEYPWTTDTNERIIESDMLNQSNRIILDACEIQSMETGYGSDGSVISETYTFFARDIIVP